MNGESCKVCRYAIQDKSQVREAFICVRFPPSAFPIGANGGMNVVAVHPPVQPHGWCGEFAHAPVVLGKLDTR